MLAMTYRAPYRVRVEDKPEPRIEHPGDAVVRVTRAAICGSDLHLYHGLIADTRVGHTFGHEFTGVVEETGPMVQNLKPGDRVMVPFNISCGTCFYCSKSLTSLCENTNPNHGLCAGIYGYSHSFGGYDGGQAEYVRVPFADAGPEKIPDDLSDDDVAFLTDAMPTGYQAAEMGEIKEGDVVGIYGAGPIGLFAAKSAVLMGAGRVIVVDHVEYRLDFARRYAGAETINFKRGDPVAQFKKLTDGYGPDVVIDAVGCEAEGSFLHQWLGVKMKLQAGSSAAINWSIQSVRRGGTVVLIGAYGAPFNTVQIGAAMNKGLTLRMAQCSVKRYLPRLIEHVRAGRLNSKDIMTHRIPLEEIADGYHLFENKKDGMIKPVVIPPRAA